MCAVELDSKRKYYASEPVCEVIFCSVSAIFQRHLKTYLFSKNTSCPVSNCDHPCLRFEPVSTYGGLQMLFSYLLTYLLVLKKTQSLEVCDIFSVIRQVISKWPWCYCNKNNVLSKTCPTRSVGYRAAVGRMQRRAVGGQKWRHLESMTSYQKSDSIEAYLLAEQTTCTVTYIVLCYGYLIQDWIFRRFQSNKIYVTKCPSVYVLTSVKVH